MYANRELANTVKFRYFLMHLTQIIVYFFFSEIVISFFNKAGVPYTTSEMAISFKGIKMKQIVISLTLKYTHKHTHIHSTT